MVAVAHTLHRLRRWLHRALDHPYVSLAIDHNVPSGSPIYNPLDFQGEWTVCFSALSQAWLDHTILLRVLHGSSAMSAHVIWSQHTLIPSRLLDNSSLPLPHKALPPPLQLPLIQILHLNILLDIKIHRKQRFVHGRIALRKRSRAERQRHRFNRSRP